MSANADVIAERELTLTEPGAPARPVLVRVGRPYALSDHHRCPVEIRWPDRAIRTEAGGADSLQALVLALTAAQSMLATSPEARESRLLWHGNPRDFGLPGPRWSGWESTDLVLPSADGASFVKLTRTGKRTRPSTALAVAVGLDDRGFAGNQPKTWLAVAALERFAAALARLLERGEGTARLVAEERKSFQLRLTARPGAALVEAGVELSVADGKRRRAIVTGFDVSRDALASVLGGLQAALKPAIRKRR
jgi:hypothetical protein